ncbi:glycosyltransferase [Gallibacterium salpingitidis]|uniref:Capsular biosynthesis protein n=1 Tax=Gallibacterium salpingitidis TaxID=505341 RepID=A0A1A7NW20_9PAST|nr:glycosyltransferase [Gallibacterium salpingitidis]OBW94402.1 capsular biosynthesis protein [Gallibacterium salpingitidis]
MQTTENKIHLLYLCGIAVHGGVGSYLKTVAQNFPQDKYVLHITYYAPQRFAEFEEAILQHNPTVVFHHLPAFSIKNLLTGKLWRATKALYQQYHFDLVHAHNPYLSFIHFYYAKQHKIKGRILHSHSSQPSGSKIKAQINRLFYQFTKLFVTDRIACSRVAGEFLFKHKPYQIIYNAIACEQFVFKPEVSQQLREQFQLDNNTIVLGHVGNFEPVKNHQFLLRIMQQLAAQEQPYKLFLVGVGPQQAEQQQWVKEHHLTDKVVFLGYRKDVPQLLNLFDLFLLPSLFEGFPLSTLESQCNGLPTLVSNTVTDEVAVTDLVHFYPINGTVDSWVTAIEQTKLNQQRESYATRMREQGFSIEQHIQQLLDYYQQVLQRKK